MGITIYWICHDNSDIKLHCHVPGSHQKKGNIFCIFSISKIYHILQSINTALVILLIVFSITTQTQV